MSELTTTLDRSGASTTEQAPPVSLGGVLLGWARSNPLSALLWLTIIGTLVYFFCYLPVFLNPDRVPESIFAWAWRAWNPETNYQHAKLIPLIAVGLVWYHRDELVRAPLGSSSWGLLFLGIGVFLFLAGVRTLQPRVSLMALPALIFGSLLFGLGPRVARILFFPTAFLLFMVPLNFIEAATFQLQFVITGSADAICHLLGIDIYSVGTTLKAADGTFGFEIAEGCSGIRSLMAMTTITAVYVHLAQPVIWKKLAVFGLSVVFAVIGNVGRIVTIVLVARFWDADLAGGLYHDYSAFIFFPIALAAMVGTNNLLSAWDFKKAARRSPAST